MQYLLCVIMYRLRSVLGFPPGSLRPAHCVRLVLLEFARCGNRHCAGGSFCNICYEICQLRCVQLPAECALLQAMHEALLPCVSFCPLRCFASLRCCAWQNCRNAKREQPAAVFLQFTRYGNRHCAQSASLSCTAESCKSGRQN